MLKLKKLEYIEDKDSIKLLIKLFNLINITIFLKNTITNNKNYKSNFYKSFFILKIYFNYNEEKSIYNAKILLLKFIHINFFIPMNIIELKISDILNLEYTKCSFNPIINIKNPIDIIIPIYNGFQYLQPLFESIFNSTHIDYRLIIVDDNSPDINIYPFLSNLSNKEYNFCKEIILIKNEENLGFVKSVNKACKFIKNHFILLNSDVVVPYNWINRLIYPIINNRNIASVTPFTNSGTICSFPNFCEDNKLFFDLDVNTIDEEFKKIPINHAYQNIPTAVGFCMAINKNIFDEVGDFDTIYGKGYWEENDWCMRSYEKGYKHLIAGNLFVYHNHGGSFLSEEKKELLKTNYSILTKKYPKYETLIDDYLKKDTLKLIRISNILKLMPLNQIKKNIIFTHNMGGGTNLYLNKLVDKNIDNKIYFIIKEFRAHNNKEYVLNIKYKNINIELIFYSFYEIDVLLNFLNIIKINKIIINHLIGFNIYDSVNTIIKLKNKYNAELIFLLHDYFSICPKVNLLYKNQYFCNVPKDFNICLECIPDMDIYSHKLLFEKILNNSNEIIAFSNSSKDIIMKAYPNLNSQKIRVIPHKVDWIKRKAKTSTKKDKLHVGILGVLAESKGKDIVKELLNLTKNDNIIFYLFGTSDIKAKNFINTGIYTHNDLVDKIDYYDIDIFIITSIWPETFSYTTEEIILMDKPIIVFNLGAPAERVSNYTKGYIVDEVSAKAMYEQLLEFYKNYR